MARKCQKCGGFVGEEDLYCTHCGMPLERVKMETAGQEAGQERAQEQVPPGLSKPLGVKEYLLIGILLAIPLVNIILAIIWATGRNENPNRRNLARAWLVYLAASVVACLVFLVGIARAAWLDERNHWDGPGYYEDYPDYYDDYYDDYYYEYDDYDDYWDGFDDYWDGYEEYFFDDDGWGEI